jgi:hypothetical protein
VQCLGPSRWIKKILQGNQGQGRAYPQEGILARSTQALGIKRSPQGSIGFASLVEANKFILERVALTIGGRCELLDDISYAIENQKPLAHLVIGIEAWLIVLELKG